MRAGDAAGHKPPVSETAKAEPWLHCTLPAGAVKAMKAPKHGIFNGREQLEYHVLTAMDAGCGMSSMLASDGRKEACVWSF